MFSLTHTTWQSTTGSPIFEAYGMAECYTFISACSDNTGNKT